MTQIVKVFFHSGRPMIHEGLLRIYTHDVVIKGKGHEVSYPRNQILKLEVLV